MTDLAGDVTSWAHPASVTLTNTVTNAQRISQITSSLNDATHPGTLAQNIQYAPHGAMSSLQNGCAGTGCTQEQETYDYNNRLQPVRLQLGTSSNPAANSCLVYNYYVGVSNPTSCSIPSQGTSGNNRNEAGHYFQDTANSSLGHTATYDYDSLNRLTGSVATGSATHNLNFSYDRYGNMTCTLNGQTHGLCPQYTFSNSTNQITNSNFTYDAAGNLTQNGTGTGTHTFQWDAEGRMSSVDNGTTASYTYNGLGQRVEKNLGGTYTEYAFDTSGEPIGENNRTSWTAEFFDFQGRHLVHYQNNFTYFVHPNTVGSTGQVTDYSGAMAQDQLHYPWGQDWAMVGSMQEERFARLRHRDSETTLDPTHFRMFSSNQGRWLSHDPACGSVTNPQSLDRYAYAGNSPTNRIDPRGAQYCGPFDPYCGYSGYCDPTFDPTCGEYGYPFPPIIVIVYAPAPPPPSPPPPPAPPSPTLTGVAGIECPSGWKVQFSVSQFVGCLGATGFPFLPIACAAGLGACIGDLNPAGCAIALLGCPFAYGQIRGCQLYASQCVPQ